MSKAQQRGIAMPQARPFTEPEIVPHASQWEDAWTNGTAPPPAVHWEMIHAITSVMDVRGKRILEVGSGTGHDSVMLATMDADVHTLDLTQVALELTRKTSDEAGTNIHLIAGDTLQLPFPSNSFDLVFSQGLVEHFSNPESVIREQARIVRDGGYLLVDVPQRYSLYTLHKRRLMKRGAWFAGWESEFSLSEIASFLKSCGLDPRVSYGYGYFPAVLSGIRNLHTVDQRRLGAARFPEIVVANIERGWRALEGARWYYRWLTSIGVIAQKLEDG